MGWTTSQKTRACVGAPAAALLLSPGCGTDPWAEPSSDSKQDTLPSTVVDPPPDDDLLSPAWTDTAPADPNLDFTATTVFCCNPLGLEFSALDCEAYSRSPLHDYLTNVVSVEDFEVMAQAVRQAAAIDRVDYIYPTGAQGLPLHPHHTYDPLGRIQVSESTYYDIPHKNCRITHPYSIFGAFLQPETTRAKHEMAPYFLPHDIMERRSLWSQADGAPADVNGVFLYPGSLTHEEPNIRTVANMLSDYFNTR